MSLSIKQLFEKCAIPAEKWGHTHFQWGNSPVGHEQTVHGSLTILEDDDDSRRVSIDYSTLHDDGRKEFYEKDFNVGADEMIVAIEGSLDEREIDAFVKFVITLPLIICSEA